MPKLNPFSLLVLLFFLTVVPVRGEIFYCESDGSDSIPPVSLKLSTFADGTVSAGLNDGSNWIGASTNSGLHSTGVFYWFELRSRTVSGRDSMLKLWLSRFSLKLYGKREDRHGEKLVSINEYRDLQCFQGIAHNIFPEKP